MTASFDSSLDNLLGLKMTGYSAKIMVSTVNSARCISVILHKKSSTVSILYLEVTHPCKLALYFICNGIFVRALRLYSNCSDNVIRFFFPSSQNWTGKLEKMLNWQIWIYDRVLLRMKKFWQTKSWMRPAQQWGLIQFVFRSLNFFFSAFSRGIFKR